MSAVLKTKAVASTEMGQTQWIERRASRLAVAYHLTQQEARREAENDYWAFRGVGGIGGLCDVCESVSHCSRHGCIPLAPVAPKPSAAEAGAVASLWIWRLLIAAAGILALLSLEARP
jgi:hypothetical protein